MLGGAVRQADWRMAGQPKVKGNHPRRRVPSLCWALGLARAETGSLRSAARSRSWLLLHARTRANPARPQHSDLRPSRLQCKVKVSSLDETASLQHGIFYLLHLPLHEITAVAYVLRGRAGFVPGADCVRVS